MDKTTPTTPTMNKAMFDAPIDVDLEQSAICRLRYRPRNAMFRQDMGISLVRHGRAGVGTGMHVDIPYMSTKDGSTKIGDMQADVKYLESLTSNELEAVKEEIGIWSIPAIRKERPDLVDEADFEMNAGFLRKVWRRITHR